MCDAGWNVVVSVAFPIAHRPRLRGAATQRTTPPRNAAVEFVYMPVAISEAASPTLTSFLFSTPMVTTDETTESHVFVGKGFSMR